MARYSMGRKAWTLTLTLVVLTGACRKAPAPARVSAAAPAAEETTSQEAASLPPASADSAGYPFRPAEKAAVEDFLRRHTGLRVAQDSDCQDPNGGDGDMRRLYGIYHPYFVRGDLNDDGLLDFVLAFVRRDSGRDTPWFSVVVFTGKGGSSAPAFSSGTFLERDVSLSRGDVSVDRDAVLITPDLSDEAVRRYRWDPMRRSHVFVRDDSDEPDTPVPSRT